MSETSRKRRERSSSETKTKLPLVLSLAARQRLQATCASDPSLKYFDKPTAAPTVGQAKGFFRRDFDTDLQVVCGPKTGWRCTAKMAVRGRPARIGMFEEGSHTLIECLDSPSHAGSLNRALQAVEAALRGCGVAGYEESDGSGDVKYVVLRTADEDGEHVELTLVWNAWDGLLHPRGTAAVQQRMEADNKRARSSAEYRRRRQQRLQDIDRMAAALTAALRRHDPLWHSIWLHRHDGDHHTSSLFCHNADAWQLLSGQRFICERLPQLDAATDATPLLHFLPSVFRQANVAGFASIVQSIRQLIASIVSSRQSSDQSASSSSQSSSKKKRRTTQSSDATSKWQPRAVELYGGVGTIGLNLLDMLASLVCSDENPNNVECFAAALASLPAPLAAKARYAPLNAADMIAKQQAFASPTDLLIVDPPRKGLDQEVLAALSKPCRHYRSCSHGRQCHQSHVPPAHLPTHVVYVSCGFKALQKDLRLLVQQGWRLVHAEGHVLFPGADHIETLVLLHRPRPITTHTAH